MLEEVEDQVEELTGVVGVLINLEVEGALYFHSKANQSQ